MKIRKLALAATAALTVSATSAQAIELTILQPQKTFLMALHFSNGGHRTYRVNNLTPTGAPHTYVMPTIGANVTQVCMAYEGERQQCLPAGMLAGAVSMTY